MSRYLALIIFFPLLGATTNALAGRKLPRRAVEWIACSAVLGAFVSCLFAASVYRQPEAVELLTWLSSFDLQAPITLFIDPLSLSLTLMITFVCGLIHIYAVAYMAYDPDYARFFALMNLFVCAMLLLILAENLPLLYLGWEGVGFCSYALIGFWYKEKKNVDAGRKAFIVTRIGDTALGIAVIWLFKLSGTVSITELSKTASLIPPETLTAIGILLLIGAAGKSAQLPFTVWLPDAMAGPTPVSAQIHAATMVTAGVYLLMRLYPVISLSPTVLAAIAVTGGLTAFYGASCAVAQRDMKRVLAYSTISQIGYMILGVGCGAVTAATFHLLTHAFFKALLFLGAGCIITAMHHEQDIYKMGGLRRSLPFTFLPFLAGSACLAGLPATGGFFSKDAILGAAWTKGGFIYGGLYILGLLAAGLTAFYTFKMVYLVFGGDDSQKREPHKVPRLMEIILIPLAGLGLFGGVLNLPGYLGEGMLDRFLLIAGQALEAPSHGVELLLQGIAGALALTGLAAVHLRYGGKQRAIQLAAAEQTPTFLNRFLHNGWYLDDLYRLLFIRPYERLAQFLWQRVDEGMIDDSLDRMANQIGNTGERIGSWTNGKVSGYILSFAAGLAIIIVYLAWA